VFLHTLIVKSGQCTSLVDPTIVTKSQFIPRKTELVYVARFYLNKLIRNKAKVASLMFEYQKCVIFDLPYLVNRGWYCN